MAKFNLKELTASVMKNFEPRTRLTQKLPEFLNKYKPCDYSDIVLVDSSFLAFKGLLQKHHKKFSDYKSSNIEDLIKMSQSFFDLLSEDKVYITKRVHEELESLYKISNYRLQHVGVPAKRKRHFSKYENKSFEKAKQNKILYEEFNDLIYQILIATKQKQLEPGEIDNYLFNIVKSASDLRKLKADKFKSHDKNSRTDEWLITHAYNQLFYNQKQVTILSNDNDLSRLLLEMNLYFNSSFMKKKTPYCYNLLQEKPIYLGNSFVNKLSQPDADLARAIKYHKADKNERKEFIQTIIPHQRKFIKLMKRREQIDKVLKGTYNS